MGWTQYHRFGPESVWFESALSTSRNTILQKLSEKSEAWSNQKYDWPGSDANQKSSTWPQKN